MNLKEWDNNVKHGRKKLAEKLSVSEMTISNIINEKHIPSIDQCINIFELTGIQIKDLNRKLSDSIKDAVSAGCVGFEINHIMQDVDKQAEYEALLSKKDFLLLESEKELNSKEKKIKTLERELRNERKRYQKLYKSTEQVKGDIDSTIAVMEKGVL